MLLKHSFESAARARWAVPVVLAMAVVGMLINEFTYQHSRSTLARGITLVDARINAARFVQELTDAELAVRRYLLSANPERLADWERARDNLPGMQALALQLSTQVGPESAGRIKSLVGTLQQRTTHLADWMLLAQQGRRADALARAEQSVPGQSLSSLRAEFDRVLNEAAAAQQVTRVSLYDAMLINRAAVHGLLLLSVLGLALFIRQLRGRDAERAQEKVRLELQIRTRTAELRELAGHLVNAREDERARVSRELHDDMGGLLTAMKLEFARLKRVPGVPPLALARLQGVEARLNDGIALKRRIVENLRPSSLDQLGLCAALQLLCDDVSQRAGIAVKHTLEELPLCKDTELTLFRLVQESLTNTIKYAKADLVQVRLSSHLGQAELQVQDNGVGFDPSLPRPGHHGLAGMRYRVEALGGEFVLDSAPGRGTRVTATVPMNAAVHAAAA